MSVLYLDIFSGISGDMFIGAMLDLGVDFHALEAEIAKLGVSGYHLHASRAAKQAISGIKFDVHIEDEHDHGHHGHAHEHGHGHGEHAHTHEHAHAHAHAHEHDHDHDHEAHEHQHTHDATRTFAHIRELFQRSQLSDWVKSRAISTFERIAIAEGKIHGKPPEEVHFHEVGAIDSIVDVAGACIALEKLGKPRVIASGVVEGTGFVKCAHGRFPIPAPATLAILAARNVPISQCEEPGELVTPTGAALLAEFVESFEPMTHLAVQKIGIGLGTRENKTRPNVLRALLATAGESASALDWETDKVAVLETNIDDLNPEVLGAFVELALGQGALDVYHTPVHMKKNRPGVVLSIICSERDADKFSELLLTQTSAFGVRRTIAERRKLKREFRTVQTPHGEILVKLGLLNGKTVQAAPEFESCRKIAQSTGVPIKDVYAAVTAAIRNLK